MERVAILDHGYVNLVESWGSDESIIAAARMSTAKGFEGWGPRHGKECSVAETPGCAAPRGCDVCVVVPGDERLLRFLYENAHATPFEMAGAIIEVKAPIFVFREWHRHRTQSYNEMSARYTPLPDENYIPTVERLLLNSKTNKQAGTVKGAEALTAERAEDYRECLRKHYAEQENLYGDALQWGVPKELARIHLPVGRYSRMRASANLRNWLAFLTLREAPNAQYEIRQYAHAVAAIVRDLFPRTHALYAERKR